MRQAAIRSLSLRRDRDALSMLGDLILKDDPHDQRLAADAIARVKLSDSQLATLASGLKNLALTELNTVLIAFRGQKAA